jgi:hypothetical protein
MYFKITEVGKWTIPFEDYPVEYNGRAVVARSVPANTCPKCGLPSDGITQQVTVPSERQPTTLPSSGYVYILINPEMQGLVKIGKTSRDPQLRASELSHSTGIPRDFILVYQLEVTDCTIVERLIHERLELHRLPGKEFFRISTHQAIQLLMTVADKYVVTKP